MCLDDLHAQFLPPLCLDPLTLATGALSLSHHDPLLPCVSAALPGATSAKENDLPTPAAILC